MHSVLTPSLLAACREVPSECVCVRACVCAKEDRKEEEEDEEGDFCPPTC